MKQSYLYLSIWMLCLLMVGCSNTTSNDYLDTDGKLSELTTDNLVTTIESNTSSEVLTLHTYLVDFEVNGGSQIESMNVEYGQMISPPINPTKDGYVFGGWYKDIDLIEMFSFTTTIHQDMTLYAEWNPAYIVIGGSSMDVFHHVIEAHDGNIIGIGSSYSSDGDITDGNNGNRDALVVKFDYSGQVIWNLTIGGEDSDVFYDGIEDTQGNLILVGTSNSTDGDFAFHFSMNIIVSKIDAEGNLLWTKVYGGSGQDYATAVAEDGDGNYVMVGHTTSDDRDISDGNQGLSDAFIIKIDQNGNIIWDKTVGGSKSEVFRTIIISSDGNYILGGSTSSNDGDILGKNDNINDAMIAKLDTNGNILKFKTYGGPDYKDINALIEDSEGNFIGVGAKTSEHIDDVLGNAYGWVIKVDHNLNILWEENIGGSKLDYLTSIASDGLAYYYIVGVTHSNDGVFNGSTVSRTGGIILKMDYQGNLLNSQVIGGSESDSFFNITFTSEEKFLISGYTSSKDGDLNGNNSQSTDALIWIVYI